jgi:hypothetical protein
MHTVRLLMEGIELLTTGKLEYPLKGASTLLDIRNGKYDSKEIVQLIEHYESLYSEAENKSILPEKPDFEKINNLLIFMVEIYFRKQI